jgi:hypothetical protein
MVKAKGNPPDEPKESELRRELQVANKRITIAQAALENDTTEARLDELASTLSKPIQQKSGRERQPRKRVEKKEQSEPTGKEDTFAGGSTMPVPV